MILVDTSAWVEYDRATGSPVDRRLRQLIADTDLVAVSEPITMEVVAGARNQAREDQLRRLMARFSLIRFDGAVHCDAAARLYRQCRREGVTPRGLIDCMIAAIAIDADVPVLTHDRDLAAIAGVTDLRLDGASLT